jgi:hypothetical protein
MASWQLALRMAEITKMTELDVIDRIVAGVLEQLRLPPAAAPRPVESSPAPKPADSKATPLEIGDSVITATLLEERGVISGPIVFGRKSVLTPSAREFLATRKLDWRRSNSAAVGSEPMSAKWLVLVTRSTPAVTAALDLIAKDTADEWSRELSGCHREAATRAVGAVCRGECDAVVIVTRKPEAAVCRANRNPNLRGAVVVTAARVKAIKAQLGPNLFAVDPTDRSAFELRNLLREIGSGGRPSPPSEWKE